MTWKRYIFKTQAIQDCRPLKFNPKYPWWLTGSGEGFVTIVAYLPPEEDLYEYWDDAEEVDVQERDEITFTDRFPKPDYFVES